MITPPVSRRQVLAGVGAALGAGLAGHLYGAAPSPAPAIRLEQSQLTQGGWARGMMRADVTSLSLDGQEIWFDKQGHFFIAFDRDARRSATLAVRNSRGNIGDIALAIAPRHWAIETIAAPFHPSAMPDADFARIRAGELARINAARRIDTKAEGWRQSFLWPTKGRISGLFGAQRVYRGADGQPVTGAYHPGIDIAVPAGTPFAAPADGVVTLAASHPFTLEGNLLMLDHGMGLNSAFLHCAKLLVQEGERVAQGQLLGLVGMTGRATGPHLHWALKWCEARLDPLLFAGKMA